MLDVSKVRALEPGDEFPPGETEEERMRHKSLYWCIGKEYYWHETEISKDEYIQARGAGETCA